MSQGLGIGQWRAHVPYKNSIGVIEVDDLIYSISLNGLFYYDQKDNSLGKIDKSNGLSDFGLSSIGYNTNRKAIIIGYTNGNIDVIIENHVTNIQDIKRKLFSGGKRINSIITNKDFAYLACSFGIVVLDLKKLEIKDTYFIGYNSTSMNINCLATDGTKLFAGTDAGVYYSDLNNTTVSDYNSWHIAKDIPYTGSKYNAMTYFNNKLYCNLSVSGLSSDTIYEFNGSLWSKFKNGNYNQKTINLGVNANKLLITNYGGINGVDINDDIIINFSLYLNETNGNSAEPQQFIIDKYNTNWIATSKLGLVHNYNNWEYKAIYPASLEINDIKMVRGLDCKNGNLWISCGGYGTSDINNYNKDGVASFIDEKWTMINQENEKLLESVVDIENICISSYDNNVVYGGSWNYGVLQFKKGKLTNIYNDKNTTLDFQEVHDDSSFTRKNTIRISGLAFDSENNLWIANSTVQNILTVRKENGSWKSFNFNNLLAYQKIGELAVDNSNQKWIIVRQSTSGGLFVFNDNNTIDNTTDDKWVLLGNSQGNGNLPSNNVLSIAKDLDGLIWIGTDKGVAVFYNPESILTTNKSDAQQILVEQDGLAQHLLSTESVTCIKIDGANQKWFGTDRNGVYLMSADGTKQIEHFTSENSPLPSNNILNLAVNDLSGEVFFATDKGLVSFKNDVTEAPDTNDNIVVYPNPVKENYDGLIAIKGVVKSSNIKITDLTGHLVFETTSKGGEAVWNGKKFNGERVSTGVYLVMITNNDGSETEVAKILFIK